MVNKVADSNNPSRARILEAARAEFSEKGFDGARVDSIAQRAEVNKALIYYYFKSKDELLQELLRDFLEERRQNRLSVADNPAKRDLPQRIAVHEADLLFEKRDILRIALMEDLKMARDGAPKPGMLLQHWLEGVSESHLAHAKKGYDYRSTPRTLSAMYFYHLMPLVAFSSFGEGFARAIGVDFETVREEFRKLVDETTRTHGETVFHASKDDPAAEIDLDGASSPKEEPAHAPQDHFQTTAQERAAFVAKHMPQGRLEAFPLKEKARLALIEHISGSFDPGTTYTERDVDAILKPIAADHTKVRRYLVDYGYLRRTADGRRYWTWDGNLR